ncbi:Copper amine oxidase, enzyme domain protein [Synechococcus sp. PCC 7335]|uniref:primary-amine oxidase n=1 Tax=Synechococcus sp. (strain ATCC 29403 / PCC 7335) TaxID=91464 RepID=UPI00017EDCDD|nr:primary-amine oxidase [Synechococcus sp. PCC 7335]EDX86269.1 Copper amine oxidase, enzyme domain protein [Synechococcus sp. PCC 7335]
MTFIQEKPKQKLTTLPSISHPLEPLTPDEIEAAVAIVREQKSLNESVRFASVALQEPSKETVLSFQPGDSIERRAFIVLLNNATGRTYEAVVSLNEAEVVSWEHIPGVQPPIMLDEFVECEAAVKASPEFQAAIAKRGITDPNLVMVDPWSAGHYGIAEEDGVRLSRALCWVRANPTDHGYARPIEGVIPVVDLNKMEVIRVEDYGVVPLPPKDGNYTPEYVKNYRTDIKPLEIVQPEGPSFEVNDHEISWQKWNIRIGFTPREGLILYNVTYQDGQETRPIFYRASLAEMTVPYGDPSPHHYRKNAFDVGEYGIGSLANSLTLGCDCLGEIYYFDGHITNSQGEVVKIENAICLHEEDFGILWKHMDWRTEQTEVRRSRRLVISFIATVGNYEYGFYWYFYQDGTIQYEVKLTGVVSTAAMMPGEVPKYGTLIAPQLNAPIHQHIFNVRMDMRVDGDRNSVYEVDIVPEEETSNPYGNAFYAKSTLLPTEKAAQRLIDPMKGRYWKIVNPSKTNAMGYPTAYKLMPGENTLPMARPSASVSKRAAYMSQHLWVTPFHEDEKYPAGDYPNQNPGGAGLPHWTQSDRVVEDTDLVVWYTFAHSHSPRAEDWPVMPVATIGFMLKPLNFFDENPANDVPPSPAKACCQ